jgi:ankyrin repeat protein
LITAGADKNAADEGGSTPLHVAVSSTNSAIAAMLIDAGVDVNTRDKDGQTALHNAVKCKPCGSDTVTHLLEAGADPNAYDLGGRTALFFAESPAVAGVLIDGGADINAKDNHKGTPLHWAVKFGRLEVSKILLAAADVNVSMDDGSTPLYVCVGDLREPDRIVPILQMLLAAKANVLATTHDGSTVLHAVCHSLAEDIRLVHATTGNMNTVRRAGHNGILQMVLAAGADVNAMDNEGSSALHFACSQPFASPSVVEMLLAAGADINAVDGRGGHRWI